MSDDLPAELGSDDDTLVVSNGIDAANGQYLLPPLDIATLSKVAAGMPLDPLELAYLKSHREAKEERLGGVFGLDRTSLATAGWGIIFPKTTEAEPLKEALKPLLERRADAAGDLYREYLGDEGYVADQSSLDFRSNLGAGPQPVQPCKIPYYLLLVGDADAIPFDFQCQLDVLHAVGRICFDSLEEYRAYADAVVAAETSGARRGRSIGFFAPRNPGDVATRRSSEGLVRPLANDLRSRYASWQINEVVGQSATKETLLRLAGGDLTPSLLFTASHGIGFPSGHPLQRSHQGALLCQDWPGPMAAQGHVPDEQYFSADDVSPDADVAGMVAFLFACYGNGTPALDDFVAEAGAIEEARIAPTPFVAKLSQRLLSRGSLAVIGHVDRAWGYSFSWPRAGTQIDTFRSTLESIMAGEPIGCALDYFNERYASISTELTSELKRLKWGKRNQDTVANLWTATTDARNYTLMGDPAVRLAFGDA